MQCGFMDKNEVGAEFGRLPDDRDGRRDGDQDPGAFTVGVCADDHVTGAPVAYVRMIGKDFVDYFLNSHVFLL